MAPSLVATSRLHVDASTVLLTLLLYTVRLCSECDTKDMPRSKRPVVHASQLNGLKCKYAWIPTCFLLSYLLCFLRALTEKKQNEIPSLLFEKSRLNPYASANLFSECLSLLPNASVATTYM